MRGFAGLGLELERSSLALPPKLVQASLLRPSELGRLPAHVHTRSASTVLGEEGLALGPGVHSHSLRSHGALLRLCSLSFPLMVCLGAGLNV